ncbi:hypothetical protein LSAT2_004477, partial [Lamellibrachia satsuma]
MPTKPTARVVNDNGDTEASTRAATTSCMVDVRKTDKLGQSSREWMKALCCLIRCAASAKLMIVGMVLLDLRTVVLQTSQRRTSDRY